MPGYINPIGAGLKPARVDMGVDYTGAGPLYALGAGTITQVYNSGWPGGTFIGLHLTDPGTYQGRYVYYAENIAPSVRAGQSVKAGQEVGKARGSYPFTEIGWAAPPGQGQTMAASAGQQKAGLAHGDPGYYPTAYGADFSSVISSLGGPPGIISGPVQGSVPASWGTAGGQQQGQGSGTTQGGIYLTSFWGDLAKDLNPAKWVGSFWKDLTGPVQAGVGIADAVASLAKDFEALVKAFSEILNAIEWFFHPSHWVRIIVFIAAVILLIPGMHALLKTGSAQAGDLTLAMGILLVTAAGILLFIAFHNLPEDITDVAGLAGWITRSVQQGSPAAS